LSSEEPSGENALRLIQIRLTMPTVKKISPTDQDISPQAGIADSSSKKAVNISSATQRNAFHRRGVRSATKIV
jgi:hypothetical protein